MLILLLRGVVSSVPGKLVLFLQCVQLLLLLLMVCVVFVGGIIQIAGDVADRVAVGIGSLQAMFLVRILCKAVLFLDLADALERGGLLMMGLKRPVGRLLIQ